MVYALLLGIADKVAPQLRRLYPDLQPEIDQYARQATWAGYYNHVMYNAYERERQRREEARSGGSGGSASFGGGGGFSGGGGGGPAAAGAPPPAAGARNNTQCASLLL